jgi:hypothetical protein
VKPKILIEKNVFWEDEGNPNAQVEAAHPYFETFYVEHFLDKIPISTPFGNPKNAHSLIDFYRGSFGLRSTLYKYGRKVREDLNFFNCLNWAPRLSEWYVNKEFVFLDALSISNNRCAFPAYVRPCRGDKIFTGQKFESLKDFLKEFHFFTRNENHDQHEICLLSNPKKIDREWRLVFVNHEYVSGALYLENFERKDGPVENFVRKIGKEIAENEYFLNFPNFVLDLCEENGIIHLLEINSIHTSSFYSADLEKIYYSIAKWLK